VGFLALFRVTIRGVSSYVPGRELLGGWAVVLIKEWRMRA
jgi:hypothetical protein